MEDHPRGARLCERGKVVAGGGKELHMSYVRIHNPKGQKTPNFGSTYGQDIEPHGEYISHDSMDGKSKIDLPNYEYGKIHFKNPLMVEHVSTGHGGWKSEVSEKFGGKTGKALSTAIKKAGHDGIVTVDSKSGHINETVNLSGTKSEHGAEPAAKASEAPEPEDRQPDQIDKDNDRLKKFAQKYDNADDFANAVKAGMGAKTVSEIYAMMDNNSEGQLNSSAVKGALSEAGNHFFLTKVDPSKLSTKGKYHEQDEDKIDGVKDSFDQAKAQPVIVGKDGEVIDGRHRTLAAKKTGTKEIQAYVSAKDFYNQHVAKDKPAPSEEKKPKFANMKELSDHWRDKGVVNDVHHNTQRNTMSLSRVVVPKEDRSKGHGSAFMKDFTDHADHHGATATLTPSDSFGGSVTRLKQFYKRHGFVENKGRTKDYSISDTMYREPKKLQKSHVDDFVRDVERLTGKPAKWYPLKDFVDGIKAPKDRYAYLVPHTTDASEVHYIPVNRLKMVYQTEQATNWDKVRENMEKMRAGQPLEPVVIGYDHDVHDGHHRWQAAKALDHTHVPCVCRGTNELVTQAAKERYGELWKSIIPDPTGGDPFYGGDTNLMFRGIGQREMDAITARGYVQSKGKGNDEDKGVDTCFTNLYQQAEGYAVSNYTLYAEKMAYVIVLPKPTWIAEDEHGELVSDRPVPANDMVVIPITNPAEREDPIIAPFKDAEVLLAASEVHS